MTDGEEARLSAASGLQEALPMSSDRSLRQKPHITTERPPFERIALILQGGGALGSYQAGVYQALAEAGLHPDWVAGISIGAINSALIAGNVPQNRVGRLREFWEAVTASPFGLPDVNWFEPRGELVQCLIGRRAELLQAAGPAAIPSAKGHAGSDQLLRHCATQSDARALGRLRPDQCPRDAVQCGRGQCPHRQFCLFRQHYAPDLSRTCDRQRLIAPRIPADRNRRRILLGRRSCFQYAVAVGARQPAGKRHARLSDRSVERARGVSAQSARSRNAAEGNSLLQPHPDGDRSIQEAADPAAHAAHLLA